MNQIIKKANNTETYNVSSVKTKNRGLNEVGLVLSSKQRRELLRLADPDRSGSVDIKELTELFYDVKIEMEAAAEVADEGTAAATAAAAAAGRRGLGSGGSMRHTISDDGSRPYLSGGGGGGRGGGSANERVERLLRRRASEKLG